MSRRKTEQQKTLLISYHEQVDLAPAVGADLAVMERDAARIRYAPFTPHFFLFCSCKLLLAVTALLILSFLNRA